MGGPGSGRRTRLAEMKEAKTIIQDTAPVAARYLQSIIEGTEKRPSWPRIECCKYVVDQALGRAKVRTELTGAGGTPLTWQAVILLAEEADQEGGPPKIPGGVRLIPAEALKPPGDGGGGGSGPKDKKGEEPENQS